ncbi:MAG: hypothetical protein ACK4GT_02060 [Pararhodobacter sp.]
MYNTVFRRRTAGRRIAPAVAVLSLVLLAVASVQAGGEPSPTLPTRITAPAETGSPRVEGVLATASRAIERCNTVTGTCRALPVEDTAWRMSDGSEWLARTAYDDAGRLEYTLWFDATGSMVGAPLGL